MKIKNILIKFIYCFILLFYTLFSFAQDCPKNIIENKKQPINFVPFPMINPETGEQPAPDERIVLKDRNGNTHEIKAVDFFNEINSLEYSLNQWGYSLRDPDGEYKLNYVYICAKILDAQKEAINKNIKKFSINKMLSYDEWKKKIGDSWKAYKLFIPSLDDLQRYTDSEKFDEYLIAVPAFDVPRPVLKPVELKSFRKQKTWSFENGEKSKFFVGGKSGYNIAASKIEVAADAFATLDGAFLNLWVNTIIGAFANVRSPGSQTGNLDARIDLLGSSIYSIDDLIEYNNQNDEEQSPFNFNEELLRETFSNEASFRFAIGPIPVKISVGIRGTDVIRWGIETVPLQIQTYLQHYASIDAYAQGAVDIIVAGVGAQARIILIALDSKIIASAVAEFDEFPSLKLSLLGTSDLTTLSGDLSLIAYIYVPSWKFWKSFVEKKEYKYTIWDFEGYKTKGTIFDYSAKLTPTGFSATGDLSVDDVSVADCV